MVVVVIDNASEKLRCEITRWLLETKPGVFVGNISGAVRDRLWSKVCGDETIVGGLLVYSSDSEQGFRIEMCGDPKRSVVDIDGIQLIKIK